MSSVSGRAVYSRACRSCAGPNRKNRQDKSIKTRRAEKMRKSLAERQRCLKAKNCWYQQRRRAETDEPDQPAGRSADEVEIFHRLPGEPLANKRDVKSSLLCSSRHGVKK